MSDIVQRLNCQYPSGPIDATGKPEFGWRDFGGPAPEGTVFPTPLMLEAAARITELEKDLAHWMNNHKTEVTRARVLKERTDMPLERVAAYDTMVKLQLEVEALRAKRPTEKQVLAGVEAANSMMTASIRNSMGGLGGCKHFNAEDFPKHLHEIIQMYLSQEICSVEGIWMAMQQARD